MDATRTTAHAAPAIDLATRTYQENAHGVYKGWIVGTSKRWALEECYRMGGNHLHTPFIALFHRCRLS